MSIDSTGGKDEKTKRNVLSLKLTPYMNKLYRLTNNSKAHKEMALVPDGRQAVEDKDSKVQQAP